MRLEKRRHALFKRRLASNNRVEKAPAELCGGFDVFTIFRVSVQDTVQAFDRCRVRVVDLLDKLLNSRPRPQG